MRNFKVRKTQKTLASPTLRDIGMIDIGVILEISHIFMLYIL